MFIFRSLLVALLLACLQSLTFEQAWAQTPTPSAQTESAGKLLPVAEDLNLTVEQQEQLAKLLADTQAAIGEILTPEQKVQLQSSLDNGALLREAIQGLNTAPRQKLKMKPVVENLQAELDAILTPEQKAQLQELQQGQAAQ